MLHAVTKWAIFCYAILLIVLGGVGYFRSDSKISLIMGVGTGIVLLFCCLAIFIGKKSGSIVALLLTLLLTGVFAYRYTVGKALLPALLAVLSGAMLIFLLAQLARWKR